MSGNNVVSLSLTSSLNNSYICPDEDVNITCSTNGSHIVLTLFSFGYLITPTSINIMTSEIPGVSVYVMTGDNLTSTVEIKRDSPATSTLISCASDSQTLNFTFHREVGEFHNLVYNATIVIYFSKSCMKGRAKSY